MLQEQSGESARPIGYWSGRLNDKERELGTALHRCLAVPYGVLLLRPYFEGNRLTVGTDHEALKWLLAISDTTWKPTRWRIRLSEFEYDIVHRAGITC